MEASVAGGPLLATKLFVPPPRANRVSRSRLRERLDAAAGGTVTLVSATAGSGKSTLLADWALASQRHVGWISLDPDDDEPRRFLGYVLAALKNAGAIDPSAAAAPMRAATPEAIDALLTELLNAIAERQAPAALVLDDFHVIENETVHGIVQKLIDFLPPSLHLVIASRVDPPLALSRLRARHMLVEIRANDLRFTPDEATRFFNESMGLGLTASQVADLEARTEGWAVGLQMAAISLRDREGARSFISGFSGTNRFVLDYLTEEVLHRQPPEVRTFLLETAVLTTLSAPLCDAMTGRTDSARILQQLDAANLFLIPLDDVRVWYRYHHLFASLLQHELERSSDGQRIAGLHERASRWYESNRLPEQALHHALAARDEERALAIVAAHARSRIVGGDAATVARWVAQLPRERVERDVDLLLINALALTSEYRLDAAMHEVELAERLVRPDSGQHHEGAVLSMRGLLESLLDKREAAAVTLERAMKLVEPDDFWFSMTSFNVGMAAFIAHDVRTAEKFLRQATAYRTNPDGLLTAILGQCYAGWVCLWRGLPDEAIAMAREAIRWIEERDPANATGQPLNSLAYGLLADAYKMRNELVPAREYAGQAIDFGRKGLVIGYSEGLRALTQIAQAEGEWDEAIASAREALCGFRYAGDPDWLGAARALEIDVIRRRGQVTGNRADLDFVARWCDEAGYLDVRNWRRHLHAGLMPEFSLTIGLRVLLEQGRCEELRQPLDEMLAEAERTERVPAQVTLLVIRSLAASMLGDLEDAVAMMRRALDVASGPGFIRLFVDEGSAVVPLVERAMSGAGDRGFAARVLAAFEVPLKPRQAVSGIEEPLSDREIEVLELVAAGATNQEAARKLIVAPSTVKKHLENIYAKLGVSGRAQAVARARELKLL